MLERNRVLLRVMDRPGNPSIQLQVVDRHDDDRGQVSADTRGEVVFLRGDLQFHTRQSLNDIFKSYCSGKPHFKLGFALLQCSTKVFIFDRKEGRPKEFNVGYESQAQSQIVNFSVSDDGNVLIYQFREQSRIWKTQAGQNGTPPESLTSPLKSSEYLSWNDDGSFLTTAVGNRFTLLSMDGREKATGFVKEYGPVHAPSLNTLAVFYAGFKNSGIEQVHGFLSADS